MMTLTHRRKLHRKLEGMEDRDDDGAIVALVSGLGLGLGGDDDVF